MSANTTRLQIQGGFPTILVAAEEGLRQALIHSLEVDGYLVFDARNEAEALAIIVNQSRPIHILLADVNMNGHELARTLEPYRKEMQVLFVTVDPPGLSDALDLESALARVRRVLTPPKKHFLDTGALAE
jgi:CheY-like chemotaxis protein